MNGNKNLTVTVDWKMGDRSGMTQAAQDAAALSRQAQQNTKTETATAIASQKQYINAMTREHKITMATGQQPPGLVETALRGGVPGLMGKAGVWGAAGLAAYGAVGKYASDWQMAGEGIGLRGHGFSGMADSIYGYVSGRNTKEALQDFRLQRGDFEASQIGTMLGARNQIDALNRQRWQQPITEIDPLKRISEQRGLFNFERMQMEGQRKTAQFAIDQANGIDPNSKEHPIVQRMNADLRRNKEEAEDMRSNGGTNTMNNLKMQVQLQDDMLKRTQELLTLRQQQVDLEHQALQQRKQDIKGDAIKFGSMSPEERMFAVSAAQRMQAKQQLTPEEISTLSGFASAQPELNKVLRKNADEAGLAGFLGAVGDESLRNAAGRAQQNNITVEQALDEQKLAEAIWKEAKDDIGELIKSIKVTTKTKLDLEGKLQDLSEKRKQIFGGGK